MPATLRVGGELIQDAVLISVEITEELNEHWWCKVECRQTEDRRFPIERCLGKDLQIVTFDPDKGENVLFDGFVLEAELQYEVTGNFKAFLTAVTASYNMDLTPRTAYYLEKKLGEAADILAGYSDLKASGKFSDKRPLNYVQWGETDFRFLLRLVDDYGCWLRPSANGIEIFDSFQRGSTLHWSTENGLLNFRIKGALGQPSFHGAHYDAHKMQSRVFKEISDDPQFFGSIQPLVDAVKGQSKDRLRPGYGTQRSRAVTLDDYEQLLKKESVRSTGGHIVADGVSRNERLVPGDTVQIEGTLDAHGTYGLFKVVHRWNRKGYLNEFWCTPWKNYTNPKPPQMKPWYGVVPARVVEHNDPKKMGRIQVEYYWQENGPAHWARMMTPHAGADRGFMFMPEIGDEVVVTFEDGDPERPVVLGCLWNGVHLAPRQEFWGEDMPPNDVKRIVTKSGHRIQLSDKEGKEAIVIATPQNLKVSLLEKADETGRPMILLHAADGDLLLSAPNGRIHLHSKFFSREVGDSTVASASGKALKPAALPAQSMAGTNFSWATEAAAAQGVVLPGLSEQKSTLPFPVTKLPGGRLKVGNNILIESSATDPTFQEKVLHDLTLMSKHRAGLDRLNDLNNAGHQVRIRPATDGNGTSYDTPRDAAARGKPAYDGTTGTGKGTGSTIDYDPQPLPTAADPSIKRPSDVGLNHELAHAQHGAHGTDDNSPDLANPNNGTIEETETINQDNEYRVQRGIPRRADHSVL